jgi:hypothetical protein
MKLYVSDLQLFDDNYNSTVDKNVIKLEGFKPNEMVTSEFIASTFFDQKIQKKNKKNKG